VVKREAAMRMIDTEEKRDLELIDAEFGGDSEDDI
jgi:hypothetical protein